MPGTVYWSAEYGYIAQEVRGKFGEDIIFRVSYGRQQCYPYIPATNPRTPRQQMWRWIFSQAVLWWHSLTDDVQITYNQRATARGGLTGFNWAVSEYLESYTHVLE